MGKRSLGSYWGFVLLALGALGCSKTKERCETLCDWINDCSAETVDCTSSEINECVDDYKDMSDKCQDTFDDFVDCLDDHDNKCADIEKECVDEATKFSDACFKD